MGGVRPPGPFQGMTFDFKGAPLFYKDANAGSISHNAPLWYSVGKDFKRKPMKRVWSRYDDPNYQDYEFEDPDNPPYTNEHPRFCNVSGLLLSKHLKAKQGVYLQNERYVAKNG